MTTPVLPLAALLTDGARAFEAGDTQRALARLTEAVQLDPSSVDAQSQLALVLAAAGQSSQAQHHIAQAATLLGGPNFLIGTFYARILEMRDADAVIALTRAWRAACPDSVAPLAAHATALQELGRMQAYHELMAFARLLQVVRGFDESAAQGGATELNRALCAHISSIPQVDVVRYRKSTKRGRQTVHIDPSATPATRAFFGQLNRTVRAYVDSVVATAPDHEWVRMKPQALQVRAWGVDLDEGGHQNAHIHPAAWLSGVYYPRMPADAVGAQPPAGWLEIGRAPAYIHWPAQLQVQMVRPEEGMLVLFPSYYWHATGPAAAAGRVSLAFDLVPAGQGYPLPGD